MKVSKIFEPKNIFSLKILAFFGVQFNLKANQTLQVANALNIYPKGFGKAKTI